MNDSKEAEDLKKSLAHVLDCTMATIESVATKKNIPLKEFNRQISIAQYIFNACRRHKVELKGTRGHNLDSTVYNWAWGIVHEEESRRNK